MKTLQILSILILITLGNSLQAQEEDNSGWIILYNEAQIEWHNLFPELDKNLKRLRDGGRAQIHCTSIAPDAGWITVYHSGRDPHSSYNKSWYNTRQVAEPIQQLCDMKEYIKRVSFSPAMGWVVLYNDNHAIWNNVPVDLQKAILGVHDAGGLLQDVAFDKDGNWLLLSGKNTFQHNGVDSALVAKMQELSQAGSVLKQVCFTPKGGWVLLYDGDKAAWNNVSKSLHEKLSQLNGAEREFIEVRIWDLPELPINSPWQPTNDPFSGNPNINLDDMDIDDIPIDGVGNN